VYAIAVKTLVRSDKYRIQADVETMDGKKFAVGNSKLFIDLTGCCFIASYHLAPSLLQQCVDAAARSHTKPQ